MAPSASRGSSPLSEVPSSPMEDRAYVEERIRCVLPSPSPRLTASDSEYMEDHEDEDIPRPAKASASSPSQLDPVESGDGRFVRGYTENGVVKQFHCAHGTCAKAFSRKSDLIRCVRELGARLTLQTRPHSPRPAPVRLHAQGLPQGLHPALGPDRARAHAHRRVRGRPRDPADRQAPARLRPVHPRLQRFVVPAPPTLIARFVVSRPSPPHSVRRPRSIPS